MVILVVEDNLNSRILLESLLTASGYQVQAAENGEIALNIAKANKPSLIISDIMMPKMDGYQLCKAVKSDNKLRDIPFIFYTATYTDPKDRELAMKLGASKFILKPMEIDEFLLEIRDILSHKNSLQVPSHPFSSEENLQKDYTKVLANKLDSKVLQLLEEQKKLFKTENKYKRLVEVLRDEYFFYSHSQTSLFEYISPSVSCILGYDASEFKEKFKTLFCDDTNKEEYFINLDLTFNGAKTTTFTVELYSKDGNTHIFEITEHALKDEDDNIVYVEGIAHDITERIISEKMLRKADDKLRQSQKMEAIGTLAGGIAHDFNNILTAIIGYTEMSKLEVKEGSKINDNLSEVLTAAQRAKDLVRQILTFSRRNSKEKEPIQIHMLVKEALKLIRPSLPSTINILAEIDKNCRLVKANATQMHQVVMNICTNAYYAMKDKGGTLAISLKEVVIDPDDYIQDIDIKEGEYVKLEVSDTGVGIAKKNLAKIFEPYYTSKPKDEGTGLGLSVVHGIIKDHKGYIAVYSELDRGTTFHIYLPVLQTEVCKHKHCKKDASIVGGSERIMLVDDEIVIGNLQKNMLSSLGYEVVSFTSARKALTFFADHSNDFDLIITDMTMPKITGATLVKEVLKINPAVPIILCTGFSEMLDKEKALKLGVKDYLMKPISRTSLAKSVRRILDSKSS